MSGFFRGTSTDQVKCANAESKLINELQKKGRFPPHFSQKVNMSKVSMDVMTPWITRRVTELLGFEDDIAVDYCIVQLKEPPEKGLDPKLLQVNLTGFMERKAATFCSELWAHLLSAQQSPVGVPKEFIEQKKDELHKKREEADRVKEELKRRREELEQQSAAAVSASAAGLHRGRDRASLDRAKDDDRSGSDRSPSPRPRRRRKFE
eukprot:TRINITY_DN51515_c0_g1_i1.p1 TRINITY_DN51515_c0_g1~~TRINITY_DN51515_c0_g1_i1.p1  ORF type:complete len:207 (+),score=42.10 TRINITY_DN51515_c0_g1_i1:77-697(+)